MQKASGIEAFPTCAGKVFPRPRTRAAAFSSWSSRWLQVGPCATIPRDHRGRLFPAELSDWTGDSRHRGEERAAALLPGRGNVGREDTLAFVFDTARNQHRFQALFALEVAKASGEHVNLLSSDARLVRKHGQTVVLGFMGLETRNLIESGNAQFAGRLAARIQSRNHSSRTFEGIKDLAHAWAPASSFATLDGSLAPSAFSRRRTISKSCFSTLALSGVWAGGSACGPTFSRDSIATCSMTSGVMERSWREYPVMSADSQMVLIRRGRPFE